MSDITLPPVSVSTQSASSTSVDKKAKRGVNILANDVVLDQLIALINSLEESVGVDLPICVVPPMNPP